MVYIHILRNELRKSKKIERRYDPNILIAKCFDQKLKYKLLRNVLEILKKTQGLLRSGSKIKKKKKRFVIRILIDNNYNKALIHNFLKLFLYFIL